MNNCTRRAFLGYSVKCAAGLALLPHLGCDSRSSTDDGILEVPADGYPLIEVEGSYPEIGRQIGSAMSERISSYLDFARDYPICLEYVEGSGRKKVEEMLARTREHFPHLVEELRGMAEGLELSFLPLFAYNCRSEIDLLSSPPQPGCSTLGFRRGETMILAHNEDGSDLNVGRMYLARVVPPSGVAFLAFVYPGLLPGNGPGFNSAGVVQTTNYIQPRKVADGVPRYFIGRAVLEARSLDEAVRLVTMEPRAFPWHHNLASLPEGRLLSVETIADPESRHDVIEVEGVHLHTNHLVHPDMASVDGSPDPPYDVRHTSTTTRWDVLSRAIEEKGAPSSAEEMLGLLSLHEGRPYSPCRHPEGDVHGATLGTAVFQAPATAMTLYHGNPCRRFKRDYALSV